MTAESKNDKGQPISSEPKHALSPQDFQRLTQFKWRYSLEAQGFEPPEAKRLLFLRWLRVRHSKPKR